MTDRYQRNFKSLDFTAFFLALKNQIAILFGIILEKNESCHLFETDQIEFITIISEVLAMHYK
jgi:hypothetical protein